jgi:hypothetical protein
MAVNGDDLMKEFDLKPGKKIGELMKKAYQWVMEDAKKRNDKTKIIRFLNS